MVIYPSYRSRGCTGSQRARGCDYGRALFVREAWSRYTLRGCSAIALIFAQGADEGELGVMTKEPSSVQRDSGYELVSFRLWLLCPIDSKMWSTHLQTYHEARDGKRRSPGTWSWYTDEEVEAKKTSAGKLLF